jgi:hypothetical protein
MDTHTKEEIMTLAMNHDLTVDVGMGLQKICADIAETIGEQESTEIYEIVSQVLYITALDMIDKEKDLKR